MTLVAAPSKACICGCSLAGTAGSNPAGSWMSLVRFVLSGRSLHLGIITHSEESYRDWSVCICLTQLYEGRYIQCVPGGKDLTSGECSLGQTVPI